MGAIHGLWAITQASAIWAGMADAVRSESFQRRIGDLRDSLRTTVLRLVRVPIPKAEYGGDHHLVTDGFQRLSDQFFIGKWSVTLGSIEGKRLDAGEHESLPRRRQGGIRKLIPVQ